MAVTNLNEFVQHFDYLLEQNLEQPQLFSEGRKILSELVKSSGWLSETLQRLVLDESFLLSQWHSVDPNDITLYRSPDKTFSVRAFIWEPRVAYPIHDHGSWGLVGAHVNRIREKKFARVDNGLIEGYAVVKEIADSVLDVGGTTAVMPLERGLHQMEAVDGHVSISIHVYGPPYRKGYIQFYDQERRTVQRVYPPQVYKKILAIRALGSISEPWANEILTKALDDPMDYIQIECSQALANWSTVLKDHKR